MTQTKGVLTAGKIAEGSSQAVKRSIASSYCKQANHNVYEVLVEEVQKEQNRAYHANENHY